MLLPNEVQLTGSWIWKDNVIVADDICRRIEWLIANHLNYVAPSLLYGDWETLFQDPSDSRYWERTYPQGDLQGGGPPQLQVIAEDEARAKYKV